MSDTIEDKEVCVMDASTGSVEIYTLPQKVKTYQDLEDYLFLELEVSSDSEWMAAPEILLSDYRNKK